MMKHGYPCDRPSDLRQRAESALKQWSVNTEPASAQQIQHLLHELQVYQIELEMQNDELRRTQQQLETALEKYADLYDSAPVGYFTLDESGLILEANLSGAVLLAVERHFLLKTPFSQYVARESQDVYYQHRRQVFTSQCRQRCEIDLVKKDKSWFPAQLESIIVVENQGPRNRCRTIVSDVTERNRVEAQIRYQAFYDPLTGLPNRALFMERLSQAIKQTHRTRTLMALLFIDLDDFKNINDTFGHSLGDLLLQEAATRLRGHIRENDTVARLGGDEFTFILLDIATEQGACIVAEKIIAMLCQPVLLEGREVFTSASIGITLFPTDAGDCITLLKNADIAMYRAKKAGRNCYRFFTPALTAEISNRSRLEQDLRHVLERDELSLHYQPIIELGSGRLIGAEALLRWRHPRWGVVTPDAFLTAAEEMGLAIKIGEWVLRTACHQAAAWRNTALLGPFCMALNLSSHQFDNGRFLEIVTKTLKETGLPATLLTFEITENYMICETKKIIQNLRALRDLGIHLAIDDFGTGYSSLSYLRRLPVDALKIDRSFIRDVSFNPDDAILVETIITMAHSLKLDVIAEGVETHEQLVFLHARGCNKAQGFYFSKPLSAEPFSELARRWKPI